MTDADLDEAYAALAQALSRTGESQARLLLATLSLALLARQPDAHSVLPLIAQAERLART